MLEVRLLGPVEVAGEAGVAHLTPTQLLIVAVLAIREPEVTRPEVLIDALWGEMPPPSAATSLRAQISRIRGALGDEGIVSEGGVYRLGPHRTDASYLEEALRSGDVTVMERARELFRGLPLANLSSAAVDAERWRLTELQSQLEDRCAESLLRRGRHTEAVTRFRMLLEEDPLRESRWKGFAEALAGTGRVPEALRELDRYRRLLADIGLEPSPMLGTLEDVLVGGVALPVPVEAAHRLIGREEDISRVGALVESSRLVTLVGPPGVGKTSLARAVATDMTMAWCDLSGLDEDDDVAATVCRAVQAPLVAPYVQTLVAFFAIRPMTIVLDNCEQVVGGVADLVSSLLSASPDARVLATSREALRVAAERVHRVRPLDATSSGVELFFQRLVDLGAEVTGFEASVVERLCRGVDGLPLAIEMAASQTAFAGFEPTLRIVERAAHRLESDRRDAVDRHRSIAALVDSSLDGLTAESRHLLGRLAAFVEGFDFESAHAVLAGDDESETARLLIDWTRRSLLEPEGEGRFRMLFTIRHRIIERAGSEYAEAVRVHARHLADLAERLAIDPYGPDERARFDRLDGLVNDLRAATFRSAEAGDVETAARIAAALFQYAYARIRADVAEWGERLVDAGGIDSHPLAGDVILMAALAAMQRSDLEEAERRCRRALEATQLPVSRALASLLLAEVRGYGGDQQAMFERSAEVLRSLDPDAPTLLTILALQNQTLAAAYQDRQDLALERIPALQRLADSLDSDIQRGWAIFCHGEVLIESDPEEALACLEDAVRLARSSGADFLEGVAMATLASLRARHGDRADAFASFAASITRFSERGDWVHQRVVVRNLVVLLAAVGRLEDAAVLVGALRDDIDKVVGPERERLDAVLALVAADERYRTAIARGRSMRPAEIVEYALTVAAD
jgi:predicted ATPase/DNA-binding SARP family transcriptional activator